MGHHPCMQGGWGGLHGQGGCWGVCSGDPVPVSHQLHSLASSDEHVSTFCLWICLLWAMQIKEGGVPRCEVQRVCFSPRVLCVQGPATGQQLPDLCFCLWLSDLLLRAHPPLFTHPCTGGRGVVSTFPPRGAMRPCTEAFLGVQSRSRAWMVSTLPVFSLPGRLGGGPLAAGVPGTRGRPHGGGNVTALGTSGNCGSPPAPATPGNVTYLHCPLTSGKSFSPDLQHRHPKPSSTAFLLSARVHAGGRRGMLAVRRSVSLKHKANAEGCGERPACTPGPVCWSYRLRSNRKTGKSVHVDLSTGHSVPAEIWNQGGRRSPSPLCT